MDEPKVSPKRRIAVVEDEPDIAELVVAHLRREGYLADRYPTGHDFLRALEKRPPDLVLLDLMLPDTSGADICRLMRRTEAWRSIPVIMVTAKAEESDKVLGLEMGADDYITKPFSLKELAARILAVLRRAEDHAPAKTTVIRGMIAIDQDQHEVRLNGTPVKLTSTEFRILSFLAAKKGRVFSRDQLLDHLWGHDKIVLDRTVDVHIRNLRNKLGPAGRFIKNVRSVGYKVEE